MIHTRAYACSPQMGADPEQNLQTDPNDITARIGLIVPNPHANTRNSAWLSSLDRDRPAVTKQLAAAANGLPELKADVGVPQIMPAAPGVPIDPYPEGDVQKYHYPFSFNFDEYYLPIGRGLLSDMTGDAFGFGGGKFYLPIGRALLSDMTCGAFGSGGGK
uniref:Uncharacterized protein n=1 Tax=Romanomermis culicivorax TaxID=13658 RepID=A0A915JFV9_ROMCU